MIKKLRLIVTLMLMVVVAFGCGKREELQNDTSPLLSDIINEQEVVDEECPEGYVYDYQVSMEPIPEEIAALGGDVCGTIHAYPTRIKIALAKQEIENDAELRKQNEKNIDAINQYLTDTYGGEFEIEPIETKIFEYVCSEKGTQNKFIVYVRPSFQEGYSEEAVASETYNYEQNAENYRNRISDILSDLYDDKNVYRVRYQELNSTKYLYLYVALFSEEIPNYMEEQKKIIQIYEEILKMQQAAGEEAYINLVFTYFPLEYEEVISCKYRSDLFEDIICVEDENVKKLIEKNEIYEQFVYVGIYNYNQKDSLENVLQDKENYLENEYILPYWRGRE